MTMLNRIRHLCLLIFCLFTSSLLAQNIADTDYLRGDDAVEFRWRFGYSEYPIDSDSRTAQEDAERGTFGWYNGLDRKSVV